MCSSCMSRAWTVTTTYTDVHRVRAKFFMSLFEDEAVAWSPLAENTDRDLAEGEASIC